MADQRARGFNANPSGQAWPGETDECGHLVHRRSGSWAFDCDGKGRNEDEPGFKFDRHRFHPILHTERAHLGVDYAAPQGTPVWASATGRVEFAGPHPGSGNTVILDHANGMQTRYYHLSKFAKGLRVGETVRQKQVIGYVGMTGLATGPHLHFSITMHGAFVDPSKYKPVREAPLLGARLAAFRAEIGPRIAELAKVATPALAASP